MKEKEKVEMSERGIIETEPTELVEREISDVERLRRAEWLAENIDRFIAAREKIWHGILKLAKPDDWVVFESKDREGKVRSSVCLTGAGAERIASLPPGIQFVSWKEPVKEMGEDPLGLWYRYWYECDAIYGGRIIKSIGRASSRDKFFSMAYGKMRELSEIDEGNIKVAAYHNCMKEGVKILFGLRNIPKAEFEKAGINLVYARKAAFPSKEEAQAKKAPAKKPRCQNCGKEITQDEVAASKQHCGGHLLCGRCQTLYKEGRLKLSA